jgi:hypothetical protein
MYRKDALKKDVADLQDLWPRVSKERETFLPQHMQGWSGWV